jgi:hypothetical protein
MNLITIPSKDDDDMPTEIDFSKGERGKFFKNNAALNLPIYLNIDTQDYLVAHLVINKNRN